MIRQLTIVLMVIMPMVMMPVLAQAQTAPTTPAAASSDTCTTFADRAKQMDDTSGSPKDGILTEIYHYVKEVVDGATKKLFNAFTGSDAYQSAINATVILMVTIFGVAFTIGVVQASFGQVLIRLVKIGIIFTLISPTGWQFFNDTMVKFFTDGVDELVRGVNEIGTGIATPPGGSPFYQFDKLAGFLVQPETLVAVMGAFVKGGPYGFMAGGMMVIASWGFIKLLIDALRIYAVSYVARALLLGLAPVFFAFLLFEKTKQLFMSWLNAIITLALQPILLFTFLAFFMVLIETAAKDMFSTELCWSEFSSIEGAKDKVAFWRFVDPKTGNTIDSEMTWNGSIECLASGRGNCPEFPINILDMLSFLILIYLATRFSQSIERIANELGNAFVSLDTGGRLDQFMQNTAAGGGNILGGSINPSAGKGGKR